MNPDEIRKILKEELQPLIKTQAEFGKTQGEMIKTQAEFGKTQKNILETLTEHGEKLDALTEELHHVRQLADVTVDVVTARYEKNKGEIDEIKDHLHLPKKPYFGNVD
jgi:chromosome segregation ATPase